jgi:hypothetical protein
LSAVLRAHGDRFDADAFVAASPWSDIKVYRRGEPKFPKSKPNGVKWPKTGLNVVASDADFDEFQTQVRDAIVFLKANGSEIRRLVRFAGVEDVGLDFAISRRDVFVQCDCFPAELVRLAGECGISLEQSHYPPVEGEAAAE